LIYRSLSIEDIWDVILVVFGFGTPNVQKMEEKKDVNGLTKALGYKNKSVFARKPRKSLVGSAMPRLW
jgi:hypothetical protein